MSVQKYSDEDEAKMRALGIPKGANVTFIDMGRGEAERKTAGWTDKQILSKSIAQLDQEITQNEKAAQGLRDALKGQEDRLAGLRMVRFRRSELGN
mgnify:CR=1 FL=1